MFVAPRRTLRAFARGKRSKSLYHRILDRELLDATVGDLRHTMRLSVEPNAATRAERLAFAGWVVIAWLSMALALALLLTPFAVFAAAVM